MNKHYLVFLLSVLLILSSTVLRAEKYALIIAIGDYPSEGLWPRISSKNDVILVRSALKRLAFEDSNIFQISDEAATQAGILQSFAELEQKIKPGDIVYIHFSGHGQQVVDDNNDEIDQLDEAIVPYDSPMIYETGVYEGERLIRDDEINKVTTSIRRKAGANGQLILILDSCHSGTGTRGMAKARGTATLMAPDGFEKAIKSSETTMGVNVEEAENLAPMASFFGSSPKELNYETLDDESRPVGSLTYAMSKTLTSMQRTYTFAELFDHVRTQMKALAPRQHPQWEGPGDVVLLSGEKLTSTDRYSIDKWKSPTALIVNAGTVAGIYTGSLVQVVDADNAVVADGSITNAGLATSTIETTSDVNSKDDLLYVRVTEYALPPLQVNIHSDVSSSKWQDVLASLEAMPIYKAVDANAELYISSCNDDIALQLATGDGSIVDVIKYNQVDASKHQRKLEQAVRGFLQGKFLRSFDNPASSFDFDLSIKTVDCNTGLAVNSSTANELQIGSCIQFVITNNGVNGGYFSILDIQPDNVINIVIPDVVNNRTASEYYLKPGQSYTTPDLIEIAQPIGAETLKLLSSRDPLDLAGIIASKGNNRRGVGASSSFENYMASTYNINTRGAKVRKKQGEDIGVKTVYFTIEK